MSFLKGFGTFVLCFLLFLTLSVFSVAFMLNSTVLSSGFITRQVDRLEISTIARDITEEQIGDEIPTEIEFLKEAVYSVIEEYEPWLKEQATQAIDAGYDFFLGRADQLIIVVPLDDFKVDLNNSLWRELNTQLGVWLRDNVETELKPYIEQNLQEYRAVLPAEFSLYSDEELISYVNTYLDEIVEQINTTGESPMLSGMLETLVRPYYDEYYNEFAEEIPDALTSADIPADVMDDLLLARKYIGYFRAAFYWLIFLMVLLIGGVFLIHRNVPDPSRALGITLALYGVLHLAGALAVRIFSPVTYLPDEAASLESWLSGIYNDVTGIMLTFSIIVLAVGAALIAVSFVVKKRAAEG